MPFSRTYCPDRFAKAGSWIGGYEFYCGILEGIQSDLDYLRLVFNLQRTSARQLFCHLCDAVQWVSLKQPIGPLNTFESLCTIYGPREGDATIVSKDEFVQLHGSTPWCEIIGWDPDRTLIIKYKFQLVSKIHGPESYIISSGLCIILGSKNHVSESFIL